MYGPSSYLRHTFSILGSYLRRSFVIPSSYLRHTIVKSSVFMHWNETFPNAFCNGSVFRLMTCCPRSTWDRNASSLVGDRTFSTVFPSPTYLGRKCRITVWRSDILNGSGDPKIKFHSVVRSPISAAIQHCVAWSNTAVHRTVHSTKPFSTAQNPTALRIAIHHFTESYSLNSMDWAMSMSSLRSCRWDTLLLSSKQLEIVVYSTSLSEWVN